LVTLGGGTIAVACLAVAIATYGDQLSPQLRAVTACACVAIALVSMNALPVRGLRLRRSGQVAEALFLDLAIAGVLASLGGVAGTLAAAMALAGGFAIAALFRRGNAPTDLVRHGVVRTLAALALLPLSGATATIAALPWQSSDTIFALAFTIAFIGFMFLVSTPLSALTYHLSLLRTWQRVARDPRTWVIGLGNVVWATVARDPLARGEYGLAIALWLPVIVAALLLRIIDEQQAELHRLRLVREAVQAMLGDKDPLPQINAILATLRVPAFDETVSVLAATSSRIEAWRSVTSLGPPTSPAGDELGRRVLARLKFSGRPSITLRDDYYAAYAFGARITDGELQGALVVHRRSDHPLSSEQMQQFASAARELAPLLRDMRSIAAAQSAATIDALTGVFNRAATLERLQHMIEGLSISDHGAVLLLDIDHFKTINDHLGHAAGDDCLRRIGEIIRAAVRSGDTAGRIGGEEFLVVMPGATRDVAMMVGERLRLAVSLGGMRHSNHEPVTASIGVASANLGDTVETLLARADRGLYRAKRQGRNRIIEETEGTA